MMVWISLDHRKKSRKLLVSFENAAVYLRNLLSKHSTIHCDIEVQFNNEFSIFSGLETLTQNRRHSMFFHTVNLSEMVMCLEDLISYFAQPEDDMG